MPKPNESSFAAAILSAIAILKVSSCLCKDEPNKALSILREEYGEESDAA